MARTTAEIADRGNAAEAASAGDLATVATSVVSSDITIPDDLTVTDTLTVGGGITGSHADGLVLSANGGKDTLALSSTTANVGLTIGADTNLYRSAADTLKTDDAVFVTGTLEVTGAQTLTGATTHSAGITGTHADGLVLSADGGKDTLALSNTTANVGLTIGADTNLYRSAANTLKTDDALEVTGAQTLTGATTHSATGKTAIALTDTTTTTGITIGADTNLYRNAADVLKTDDALTVTGATTTNGGVVGIGQTPRIPAVQANSLTFGTDKTPVITETALVEVPVPANVTLTGVEYLIGSVGGTDSVVVALYDSAGVAVANSALAGTVVGTTATWQQVPFTATYAAKGPGLYYIGLQVNGVTARYRTIPVGPRMATSVKTGETFGTLTLITPPTAFTADVGPVCGTY